MISPLSIILILIFLVAVPFILGLLTEGFFIENSKATTGNNVKGNKDSKIVISRCFTMGFVIMLSVFQLFSVPMIFIGTSFNALLYTWTAVIVFLVAVSLYLNAKTFSPKIKEAFNDIKTGFLSLDLLYKAFAVIAFACIIFQVCLLVFKMHVDTDDSRFLAEALEAVEKNTMLRVHPINGTALDFPIGEMRKDLYSPFPFFVAALSVLTRLHPTVLAHSVLPVLLIILAYAVYYLLSTYFFTETKDSVVFMYVLSVIMIFSFESIYSLGYTLLTIIWQGRSILATIVIPFLWYVLMKITTEDMSRRIYIVLIVTTLAGACLSGMGALICPLIGAGFALSNIINNKKIMISVMIVLSMIPCGVYAVLKKFFTSIILKLL